MLVIIIKGAVGASLTFRTNCTAIAANNTARRGVGGASVETSGGVSQAVPGSRAVEGNLL